MNDEDNASTAVDQTADISAELKSIQKMRVMGLNLVRISPIVILPIAFGSSAVAATCMNKKCPQCGKPFYGMPIRFFWAHSCMHCKVSYKNDADS